MSCAQYNALVRNITSGARGLDEEGMRAHLAAKLPRLIPYKNSFIINTETWSAGDLIKQPKHLSLEGRLNRAARGHVRPHPLHTRETARSLLAPS